MAEIKTERETVKTPLPENEDGSGYTTEESEKVRFMAGEHRITVSRVTDRGWSIWHHSLEDGEWETEERIANALEGFEAKRMGRRAAEEVA